MARQRLGQHFLADAGWLGKIARAIHISPHGLPATSQATPSCWIEVGAGHGEMTEHLAATGEPVYAIELDPLLVLRLRRLSDKFENLSVVQGDVLETDLTSLSGGRRIRIYGNLPYYITSPILHHFFRFADWIDEIHIVIQREVAYRLVARPATREYGYLSVLTQYFSQPAMVLRIPPGAFRPPPEVGSALISMKLPGEHARLAPEEEARFFDFVKLCFAQKRKTLLNNLRSIASPEEVRALLAELRIKPAARAEELGVTQLAELYGILSGKKTGTH
jgi:16S rRNA (adenine1518-N6/adenine1519-N6)-dimethyltransferase